jgi:hypothetical protein
MDLNLDLLVPNQEINQPKLLSWRHLWFLGPLSDGQVWTSECHAAKRSWQLFSEGLFWIDDP